MPTTALPTSFKSELMFGAHIFGATVTPTGTCSSANVACTAMSSLAGVSVGMNVSGTSIAAGTVVAAVPSASTMTLSKNTTGAISGGTFSIAGDVFYCALVKVAAAGTYDSTFQNVGTPGSGAPTASNLGTDEVTGTGYVANGVALVNVSPATSGTTAYTTFSANPSWSSASFSAIAAVIYNTAFRLAGVANRVVYVGDLGGTQTVSSGTMTLVLPIANSSTALIRLQ